MLVLILHFNQQPYAYLVDTLTYFQLIFTWIIFHRQWLPVFAIYFMHYSAAFLYFKC